MLDSNEIEKKVILLKLLVKNKDESTQDALISLADTKMATLDELKNLYKELQDKGYINKDGNLTFIGINEAKKAQKEFKI